jgi:ribosomal protein S18 acetylase RimI-like enzyme
MVTIRRIQPGEGTALRDIRLRAICDTPDAFAVSLANTLAQSDAGWTTWATVNARGESSIMYVAEDAPLWIGMAGGMLDTAHPEGVADLISVWVDPDYRGRGLGRRLVEQVAAWARGRAVRRLELWVTEGNTAAIELYSRCGFRVIGGRRPLPSQPALAERRMVRDL